jgi:hypothetical protein
MSRIYDTELIEHIKDEIEAERAQAPLKVGEDEAENKQSEAYHSGRADSLTDLLGWLGVDEELPDEETSADTSLNDGVPESVKLSQFGCFNCLWFGVECQNGSRYESHEEHGKINCVSYASYD